METTLRDLRYFVCVAEHEHLGRAAKRLHVSAATLSEAVRRLERSIGIELFLHQNRGLRLTADGASLLRHAEAAIDAADRFVSAANERRERISKLVHVGTLLGRGADLALGVESMSGPRWSTRVHSFGWDDTTAGLRDRRVDAAILAGPTDLDPDIESTPLGFVDRCAAVGSDHRLARQRSVTIADLDEAGWIDVPTDDVRWRQFWFADLDRGGAVTSFGRRCDSPTEIALAVAAGDGVALTLAQHDHQFAGYGIVLMRISDLAPAPVRLAYRRDRRPREAEGLRTIISERAVEPTG